MKENTSKKPKKERIIINKKDVKKLALKYILQNYPKKLSAEMVQKK